MKNEDYKRIARIEALANARKSELLETLRDGYERACAEHDEEAAASFARKIRNKLLDESDKTMPLDRMGLEAPEGDTFEEWLPFLRRLGVVLNGEWALYRKALRDLPEQPGFPFDITFPEPPNYTEVKP